LYELEAVLNRFGEYCRGLNVVDVCLKQINVSTIYKKTPSEAILSHRLEVDEENISGSDDDDEEQNDKEE
jgi:hypothetical protein